jgi:anti-sigma regulatory factor (Ser/Thr protein kinase)
MSDGWTWLRLPADMASLAPFTEFAREAAQAAGLPPAALDKLELVLEEALVNVFRYAYPDPGGEAALGFEVVEPGCIGFEVRDGGQEFNPLDRPDPDLHASLEDRPIGGLGIYLIHTLAEEVQYRRVDRQNVLSFRLR